MGLRVLVEYGLMGFGFWVGGSLRVLNFSGYTRSRVTASVDGRVSTPSGRTFMNRDRPIANCWLRWAVGWRRLW